MENVEFEERFQIFLKDINAAIEAAIILKKLHEAGANLGFYQELFKHFEKED